MHIYGQFKIYEKIIANLRPNLTNHRTTTVVGSIASTNDCEGAMFEGEKNLIVRLKLTIILSDYLASVNTRTNTLQTALGTTCVYTSGKCIEQEETDVF